MKFYLLFVTLFILFDILTGWIAAIANKNYKSSIMRVGLYHKIGLMLTLLFGVICDYAQRYIDIGLSIPFVPAISIYIVVMEISSIAENIHKLNPEISVETLKNFFGGKTK